MAPLSCLYCYISNIHNVSRSTSIDVFSNYEYCATMNNSKT